MEQELVIQARIHNEVSRALKRVLEFSGHFETKQDEPAKGQIGQ